MESVKVTESKIEKQPNYYYAFKMGVMMDEINEANVPYGIAEFLGKVLKFFAMLNLFKFSLNFNTVQKWDLHHHFFGWFLIMVWKCGEIYIAKLIAAQEAIEC